MSSDAMLVLGIISFIPYILFIPLSIYGTLRLYRCRKELFVQKRNVEIALGLNCALIFQMISSFLTHLSVLYFNPTSLKISFSIFLLAYWILLYFLNCKNWIIYFNEKWTKYALDLQWQQIINPQHLSDHNTQSWFIANRHKYGNLIYIFKLFGILHFIGFILLITAQYILISSKGHPLTITFSIIMIIFIIIPYIIFYVFLVFKTPRFNDIFNIHWESQMHARLVVIMGIGLIIGNSWYAIDFNNNHNIIFGSMLCFPFVSLILFIMIMVSTLLIIKKYKQKIKINTMTLVQKHINISKNLRQTSVQSTSKKRNSSKLTITNQNKRFYTLDLILSNKDSFHLFMVHLAKEFSMECLLAYVELTQFQQYIIKQNSDNNKISNATIKKLKLIEFPPSIPMSGIVENGIKISKFNTLKNNAMEYKLKLNKLFDKYIKIGSPLEINISYQQRSAWMNMMSTTSNLWSFMHVNVDLNELLLLIEQCKVTMTQLLDHSLHRFKTYNKFNEILQIEFKPINMNKEQSVTQTKDSRLSAVFHKLPSMRSQQSFSKSASNQIPIQPSIHEDIECDNINDNTQIKSVSTVITISPQSTVRSMEYNSENVIESENEIQHNN